MTKTVWLERGGGGPVSLPAFLSPVQIKKPSVLETIKVINPVPMETVINPVSITDSKKQTMSIFKSKPGGSFLGNMIRGAANKFSGGLLGNGAMLKASEAKAAGVAAGNPLAGIATQATAMFKEVVSNDKTVQAEIKAGIWAKYKIHIMSAGAALLGLIIYLATRKKKGYRSR